MSDIRKLDHQAVREAVGSVCHGSAGLAEGTNANTIQIARAISYSIGGRQYNKAITDNIAMTALAAQAALTDCMYLVLINAAGTVSIVKGVEVANGAGAALPDNPDATTYCVIGAFKIATAAATTFTSGTTDLSAAGITDTFYDLSHVIPGTF